uniref:ShKT domain-containing protein n=1 Tax=Acrobeloides nanus TaxID=290746 RepID=A0A914DIA8_9BILA
MWTKVVIFLCLVGFCQISHGSLVDVVDFLKEFTDFIKNFKRTYKNPTEQQARFETFKENFQELLQIQQQHQGTNDFGITDFMDWTKEERALLSGVRGVPTHQEPGKVLPAAPSRAKRSTPTSYNWQTSNKVTPVKNQGQCGSCWAFASVAVMETAWAIKNGSLLDLSEQNLVSCVTSNSGCQGGYPPYALIYERSTGIASESAYPYTATNGTCKSVAPKTVTTDWWYVGTDESQLTTQLYSLGALVYTMWVPNSMFYLTNTSGVYYPSTSDCQTAANAGAGHAVTVVGYGVDSTSGYPYWLIKNSWGTSWGNAGYFKLYRGANVCSMGSSWWAASATSPAWTCTNVDDEDSCKQWQGLGYCASTSQYYSFMTSNCKAACGLCSSG